MKMQSIMFTLLSIPLLLAGCFAPGGENNAEKLEPATITSTVTSEEKPAGSTSSQSQPAIREVDPQKFYSVDAYGNDV